MASIRKRNGKWQVQVRKKGSKTNTRTFGCRDNAKIWAKQRELEIETGSLVQKLDEHLTVGDLVARYAAEITPTKKGRAPELRRLQRLLNDPISKCKLGSAVPAVFASFRDRRLRDGVRASSYDLVLLRHMFNIAKYEWGIPLADNPLSYVKKPAPAKPRERRLSDTEHEALEAAANQCRNPLIWPIICFAIETGMRRGEILKVLWADLDQERRVLLIRDTKNGDDRTIPLSRNAEKILFSLSRGAVRIFPLSDYSVRHAWDRLVKRARVQNLRFHDLRHEAISRFFEQGLSIAEVALISGHRDVRQLFRYTHLRAEDVARKL